MEDEYYIRRCFELAQRSKGHTAPNPMVGAVLVHNDRIIGEGWHHFYGGDHAEVNCLKNVVEPDRHLIPESTMYVNLEPCAHQGITPPCANRLVEEKIKRVVIANTDPFEKARGKGIAILKEAGIQVTTGVCEDEGKWVNRRFFCFHAHKLPYIVLKWAQSKDGFMAPLNRIRFQITSEETRKLVHKWRTEEGAIMVGTVTALNDNPKLTARHWEGLHPLRVVLDRNLQVPDTYHVFDRTAATWIINEKQEILNGNVHFRKLAFDNNVLINVMHRLHDAHILSVIVEGGPALLSSFIEKDLWDEARILTGTMSMGEGLPAPALGDKELAFATMNNVDELQVYLNKHSEYKYVQRLEL